MTRLYIYVYNSNSSCLLPIIVIIITIVISEVDLLDSKKTKNQKRKEIRK